MFHSYFNNLMMFRISITFIFFFFNDTATTEIYTLSLHDALPISDCRPWCTWMATTWPGQRSAQASRSEEHTSELQSPCNLVCRLLLEKKKRNDEPLSAITIQDCKLISVCAHTSTLSTASRLSATY